MSTAKLVFDIETIGNDFDLLDDLSKEYFLRFAQDPEKENEIKEGMAFYPLTGEVIVIGMLNPDTQQGKILIRNDQSIHLPNELEPGILIEQGSEKEILEKFWETIKSYNYFISFNGRAFDVPFLMIRSAILEVKPSKNLLSNRYLGSQKYNALHIDLLDQLTFYGITRKFNLHFWTKAFGIKSPKEDGIKGSDMNLLYKNGKILEIARYNLRDLQSTAALYQKWNKYLNI